MKTIYSVLKQTGVGDSDDDEVEILCRQIELIVWLGGSVIIDTAFLSIDISGTTNGLKFKLCV